MYSSLCLSGTKTPAEPSQIALCGTGCEGKMKEGCCVQRRMRSSLLDILFYKGLEERKRGGIESLALKSLSEGLPVCLIAFLSWDESSCFSPYCRGSGSHLLRNAVPSSFPR